jgi:hypothetical protein
MANTYTLIESKTVGSGGAASIEFTSIPQTYTDLFLATSLRTSETEVNNWVKLTFNNTAGTSNNVLFIRANGTNVATSTGLSSDFMRGVIANGSLSTGSVFSSDSVYIPGYTSSNQKVASIEGVMENNATSGYIATATSRLTNTAAVTSIQLTAYAASLSQYSTAYLYGIKNS